MKGVNAMIDVEQACEIATKDRKEPFVEGITDIGRGFVIGTMTEDGEVADIPPVFMHKDDGKIEDFFVPDHFEELENGKEVDVPKKYQFNG